MPHSGRIKKIICHCLTVIYSNKIIDNLNKLVNKEQFNELENYYGKFHFKDELFKDINKVNFSTYKDIKKGDPLPKGKTFFKIVKFSKSIFHNHERFVNNLSDVVEDFENVEFTGEVNFDRIETFIKFSNHDIIPLKEGESINICITDFRKNLFSKDGILVDILKKDVLRLLGTLNFNFTFLIELDPL